MRAAAQGLYRCLERLSGQPVITGQPAGFGFVVGQCQQRHFARNELVAMLLRFLVRHIEQIGKIPPNGNLAAGALHLEDLRRCPDDFEPLSVDRFIAGALQPAAWYVRAQRFRRLYRDKVNALFQRWDLLLAPATPVPAQPIGTEWLEIQGQRLPCRAAMGLLTQPISFAGCPVVTAPVWPDGSDGLPLGVQLIAAPWREDVALRAAQVLASRGIAYVKEIFT